MSAAIVVLVFVVVAGGLIAYGGDLVGYRLGRKRLTIFGLRPRHTATLLTVTTGMVISATTFCILFGIDSGFRIAITQGAQLLSKNHQMLAQNRLLEQEMHRAALATQQADDEKTQAQIDTAKARSESANAQSLLASSRTDLLHTQAQLVAKQELLVTTTSRLSQSIARLSTAQVQLTDAEKNLQILGIRATILGISTTKKALGSLPIYRFGAELGRVQISSELSVKAIKQQLVAFLGELSDQALKLGARKSSTNNRAVVVTSIQVVSSGRAGNTGNTKQVRWYQEQDSLNALAEGIHDRQFGRVVVIAYAFGNAFTGEPTVIALKPYVDRLVIPAGTVVAVATVPPGSSAQIYQDLQMLLMRTARQTAKNDGVIPHRDPQTNQVYLVDISPEQLVTVVGQISQVKGPALVTASAAKDTYSADTLSLVFNVRPVVAPSTAAPPPNTVQ